jgi:outer membrane lipopolysaccharide assembly protein LptE/RlpB
LMQIRGFCPASARLAGLLAALLALTTVVGACNYGFRGGGGFPSHIRTVYFEPFENETPQFDVDQQLLRVLTERLPRALGVRLAGERAADAVVRGRVTRYNDDAVSYPGGGQTGTVMHQVQITLSITIVDVQRNEILYESSISGRGEYRPDSQSDEVGRGLAINALIQQIIDGAQSQW